MDIAVRNLLLENLRHQVRIGTDLEERILDVLLLKLRGQTIDTDIAWATAWPVVTGFLTCVLETVRRGITDMEDEAHRLFTPCSLINCSLQPI